MYKIPFSNFSLILVLMFFQPTSTQAQSVSVGEGSYSTTLPAGAVGPQYSNGQPAVPKISADFSQNIQTNDFWSSLIFPFFGEPYSAPIFAHPLTVKAVSGGLQMGYTSNMVFAGSDYLYPFSPKLTVGVEGLNALEATTKSYTDWTATAEWSNGNLNLEAAIGHGLPFVYFRANGGDAVISTQSTPSIWYNQDEVIGMTIDGQHYGVFAPDGSEWNGSSTLTSSLNGKDYFSIAILPDSQTETLEMFRERAYAFVTNSSVQWNYEEAGAQLTTTFTYETELMEDVNGNLNETLSALYRHQWLYAVEPLTDKTYNSPRGIMKLYQGNQFSTQLTFSGILPSLPDKGDYDRAQLLLHVQNVANESLGSGSTYNNGKEMGRFAELVHIADQLGATEERDYFLNALKDRLEDWFTVGGAQEYSYNEEWDVLTGYPSGFGADREINDHHFHSSYAIRSAAVVAQYDPEWAEQDNWGGMVNMLIRDSNNWSREDGMFPFLRAFDIYAGHSWAAGHGAFGDGNNQESSSESMNFSSSVFLWGSVTGQEEIRDLGIYLHTTERTAIEQYWFDVNDAVFPNNYNRNALGIVWGGKGAHTTWFGNDPEFIHGINFLPLNSGSLYLGRHPDYVEQNYAEVVSERGGQPTIWKDIFWQYLALSDPDQALSYYLSDPNYQPFDGESRAHTMHWLYNMKQLGKRDTTITANIPTFSVFQNGEQKTYVAFNAEANEQEVNFSDGYSMMVPAGEMLTESVGNSVSNEEGTENPLRTILNPNYPNPFNPVTTISFSLRTPAEVTLEVFNSAGQKVATLMQNQSLGAGSYSELFDAEDLSSGLYIYRLQTSSGYAETRKMMLIK